MLTVDAKQSLEERLDIRCIAKKSIATDWTEEGFYYHITFFSIGLSKTVFTIFF